MVYKPRKGFTLIELIMVILIIAVISVAGSSILVYVIQNAVFIPNQLNMDMIGQEALDIMIEGDGNAKGLRFSRAITAIAVNQVDFVNQDSQAIRYRLDTGTNKLYRSIAGGGEALIPYYVVSGINITGESGALFTYYDASNVVTATPANVRRIAMTLIAKTGSGSFANWQGQSEQSSSIAVSKFQ